MEEMLSCPFCGSAAVDIHVEGRTSYVQCLSCKSRGSPSTVVPNAYECWNRRTSESDKKTTAFRFSQEVLIEKLGTSFRRIESAWWDNDLKVLWIRRFDV